jgi:putative hydrolase of the HAD superfamily
MLIEAEGVEPERTLVVDDMADNLAVATELSCKTVWITHKHDPQTNEGRWDYHVPSFHSLPDMF